jgi:hypothetical protein
METATSIVNLAAKKRNWDCFDFARRKLGAFASLREVPLFWAPEMFMQSRKARKENPQINSRPFSVIAALKKWNVCTINIDA